MIRVSKLYYECKFCDAYKPGLALMKTRENGETTEQYVMVKCLNDFTCSQIHKAINRRKEELEKLEQLEQEGKET